MWRTLVDIVQGKDDVHWRFSLGGGIDVVVYECPGRWCDDAMLASIVDDLRTVARAGQQGKDVPMYGPLLGDRGDLSARVITLVYQKEGGNRRPVAFNAMLYLPIRIGTHVERVLHLGLTFVDPTVQQRHLSNVLYGLSSFLFYFRNGMRPYWISSVTQVPRVAGLTASGYRDVYPSPDPRVRQSFGHLMLARAIMKHHRQGFGVGEEAGFDEVRQVITNAYTGGSDDLKKSFDDAPKHRDPRVNELCRTWLDYDRGDDLLQIGRCDLVAILGFLRGKMPSRAVGTIVGGALALVLGEGLRPVLRWLVAPSNSVIEVTE